MIVNFVQMVEIIFEAHSTTFDNEADIASGHFDVALSPLGEQQSRELGERYKFAPVDVIFCSDLQRSYKTAEIAFGNTAIPIVKDARLREIDYGELTQKSKATVDNEKLAHISTPFPRGESYESSAERMKSYLNNLLRDYDGQRVMIIGHRATQYGLEYWLNNIPLETIIKAKWHWQPGWTYQLSNPI